MANHTSNEPEDPFDGHGSEEPKTHERPNWVESFRRRLEALCPFELELPPREPVREPPSFE